jgi:hypothetical protein
VIQDSLDLGGLAADPEDDALTDKHPHILLRRNGSNLPSRPGACGGPLHGGGFIALETSGHETNKAGAKTPAHDRLVARVGARVASQQLPYPPRGQA